MDVGLVLEHPVDVLFVYAIGVSERVTTWVSDAKNEPTDKIR
jgi:hypothetical protein